MHKCKKNYIYLDSAATASVAKFDVADEYANPNSVHDAGRDSFAVLEHARESIAAHVGAKRPSEVVFTSGATEANNMAIFGIARAQAERRGLRNSKAKPRVIISAIEHESVTMPAKELVYEGFDLKYVKVDHNGCVDPQHLRQLLNGQTVLVSIQHANTEIGTVQNLRPLVDLAHEQGVLFHSDFVGSFGRLPIDLAQIGVDAASFSGHKIGTAKGIGFLYLKAKTPCKPLIFGSGQENGLRGGTQNVALALQLEKALDHCAKHMKENAKKFGNLKTKLLNGIWDLKIVWATVDYCQGNWFLPNIVHLTYEGFSSESLILHYGKYNIQVSGGPACSSDDKEPSHVLKAIGADKKFIDNTVRISFCEDNTPADIEAFLKATARLL